MAKLCEYRPGHYIISEGPIEPDRKRPISWSYADGKMYCVCPKCRAVMANDNFSVYYRYTSHCIEDSACWICRKCRSHNFFAFMGKTCSRIRPRLKAPRNLEDRVYLDLSLSLEEFQRMEKEALGEILPEKPSRTQTVHCTRHGIS